MSSVVAEANSHFSAPGARAKAGQGNQTSGNDGFSGLVDDNLAATSGGGSSPAERPRQSASEGSPDPQPARRTGIQAKPRNQPEPTRRSTNPVANDARPADETVPEQPAAASDPQAVVRTGLVAANVTAAPVDAEVQTDAEDAAAPAAATSAPDRTIVATAVTVQIEFATEGPAPQIDSGDAITLSNPPATVVALPAEAAANALARVANDTADPQPDAAAETDTPPQAETDAQTLPVTTDAAPAAEADVATTDIAVDIDASLATPVSAETAAAEAQLDAKTDTGLSAAASTVDPSSPVDQPKPDRLIASNETRPIRTADDARAAPEPPAARPTPEADRHDGAQAASGQPPGRPAETESRPPHPTTHEPPAANPTHASATPSDNAQPGGYGVTQVAPLHVPGFAAPASGFTAIAAAANVAVPLGSLAVEIAANVQIGRSRFEIRLDPPELGRIDVRLDVDRQGQVTSHLIVEKSATLDLLRRDAQQLERALQDAGLKTSDNGLQFSLRDQQQQAGYNDGNGSERNARRLIVADEETLAAETAGRSYGRTIGRRGGIDIRV